MYPPHSEGGYELAWRSCVQAMRGRGWDVRVLASDHRVPAREAHGELDADVHRSLEWYWRDHGWRELGPVARASLERRNARRFDRHLAEFQPDLVQWWSMGGMSLSLVARAAQAGLPSVAVVCDDWLIYAPKVDGWTRALRPRQRLAPVAARVVGAPVAEHLGQDGAWLFLSNALVDHARARNVLPERFKVVHRGTERGLFPAAAPRDWRWRLLAVGRLDPRKGLDVAIRSLVEMPEEATLTIVGDGDEDYGAELAALVGGLGLADRVDIVRHESRTALAGHYAAADAVLFPVQWEEPWGLVPLEAMAVGRPVVATGTGGSAEYLRDEENCLVYSPPDDPGALATAVSRLAGNAELRARLRDEGFRTSASMSAESFDEAICAASLAEVERAGGQASADWYQR